MGNQDAPIEYPEREFLLPRWERLGQALERRHKESDRLQKKNNAIQNIRSSGTGFSSLHFCRVNGGYPQAAARAAGAGDYWDTRSTIFSC